MDYAKLKELDLSREEIDRLGSALRDENFKRLFFDYVDELHDPENVRLFQSEMTQLEKERGVDVTFINPTPGYVIKTSVDGHKKCFVNVCANENVQKPSSSVARKEGARGLQWALPHTLAPVREDVDRKGVRCDVYDVVFHPDTLHLAQNNRAFRDMLSETACDAVESSFSVALDKKNLKFPKLQYKGAPHAAVIRRPSEEGPAACEPEDRQFFDRMYAAAASEPPKRSKPKKPRQEEVRGNYARPTFVIKHRSRVDMQDFTESRDARMNAAIPKELIVEVDLPLLKASSDITLDVTEKTIHLVSEKPAKYKLEVTLPYEVNQDSGNAKFDKDRKKLVITLPVKRKEYFLEDSGVESDPGSSVSTSPSEERAPLVEVSVESEIREPGSGFRTSTSEFLDENLEYNLPDFACHVFEGNIAFTLNVKNVSENSIEKVFDENQAAVHVKFTSVGASFFPTHYAFYVKLLEHSIDAENASVEAWDNNVVLQFPFKPSDEIVAAYLVGLRESEVVQKYVEEPHILNGILQEETEAVIETKPEEEAGSNAPEPSKTESKAIDIVGNCSESSGDELSCSYSPSKSRGILKRLGRRNVSRSISESSLDDIICASSFENCHTSLDSVIPEDGAVSTSLKKTVRFNDHVSKQLYRSNSSILGQKKKNQRKKSNKKRALERRCSESEASEAEDKKEKDEEEMTERETEMTGAAEEVGKKEEDFCSDVFQLDMYF